MQDNPSGIIWSLYRYAGQDNNAMDGLVVLPEVRLGAVFSAAFVCRELNERNCFDFMYDPEEGDYLVLSVYRANARSQYRYMAFLFENGRWIIKTYDPFRDKIEEIGRGKIRSGQCPS